MSYTPPAGDFVNNSSPVGGGAGVALDADFFAALVAGVDDADTRLTAVEAGGAFLVDAFDYGFAVGATAAANTAALDSAVAAIPATGGTLLLRPGSYATTPWTITGKHGLVIKAHGAVLTCPTGNPLTLQGSRGAVTTVTTSITAGANQIVVASGTGLAAGDLIIIRSGGEVFDPERPTQYYKGELAWITGVSGSTVTLESRTYDSYSVSGHTVSIDKLTPIRDVTVTGLKIIGGGTDRTQTGMQAFHFDGATFEDCSVDACEQVGIVGRIGTGLSIRNNRITRSDQTGLGYGVRAIGVDHGQIDGNIGRRNRHTVDVDYEVVVSRNIAVTGNHATGDASAGISTHGGAEHITVEGNFTSNCGGGLVIRSGNTRVAGNQVKGTRTQSESSASYVHGLVVGDDSPNLWGVGVAGNGLQIVGNLIDITHPSLAGAATFGIFSTVALKDAVVTGNRLAGFANYGIYLKGDTVDGALIADNYIDCTSQVGTPGVTFANGIFIEPGHNTVSGNNQKHLQIARNHIYGALYSAIRIVGNVTAAAPSDDIVVVDNILAGYGLRGVDMTSYFKRGRVDRNLYPDDGGNRFVYTAANWTIPPDVGARTDTGLVTTGEETQPRELASANSAVHPGTGILWLTYFTARKTESCGAVRVPGGVTLAGATPTLVRFGMYEVAPDGSLTLVASTANDTTLFATAFNTATRSWTAPFIKVAGKRYAIGILIVSAAAMPSVYGNSGNSSELGRAPMICSQVSSLTDLPSTVTTAAQSTAAPGRWFLATVTP